MQCVDLKDKLHDTMNEPQVQWIGSSCGRHGSYTFFRGFKININGTEKSYCLGEFYFVRNSEDRPICIAELQLIWHDASNDSKLASARLYFRPENTPFGRQSMHGKIIRKCVQKCVIIRPSLRRSARRLAQTPNKDELLYADQKVIIKCEDMTQWECSGSSWRTGLIPTLETDFVPVKDTCINKFTGKEENKYKLQNTSLETTTENIPTQKAIIVTFQAYCRYIALQKRLLSGMTIGKSEMASLGGITVPCKSTRIAFCRDSFSCPDLDQFHLSGEYKAPVLKGRPRKKKIRNSTLAKELKRKRFLADLERVKRNLPCKKVKLSESEEGTESDLSEESKSYESMDEDKPHSIVETPINKKKLPNGLLRLSIKQVGDMINIVDKDLKHAAPPPLIPTSKVKTVPYSPPPLQKVKLKTESLVVPKVDAGPPPLYPAVRRLENIKKTSLSVPRLLPRVGIPETARTQENGTFSPSSKVYTVIKSCSIGVTSLNTTLNTTTSKPEVISYNGIKSIEPLGNVGKQPMNDSKTSKSPDDTKMEGKENQQDSNKTDVKIKKKRLRQPCNVKELNEDVADEDEKYFMRSLREFMKSRNTPISKIPALGFKRVNLWTMYNTAQKLGGYDMVTSKRLWRQVYDALGGSTTITSAATYTRRHYERLLLPYESYARSQLSNKKGISDKTQSSNATSGQDITPKAHLINNQQSDKATNNEKSLIRKGDNTSYRFNNQSNTSTILDSNNESETITFRNEKTRDFEGSSNSTTPGGVINQTVTATGTQSIATTDKPLLNNIKTSRNTTNGSVVKVKANDAIPPYSISIQGRKEICVTSSPSVIVKKSSNAPSSPIIQNSRISSFSTSSTKSDIHVTSYPIQRGTTVTTTLLSRGTVVTSVSSPSSRTVINATPVKSSSSATYPLSVKQSPVVKVQAQKPQNHSYGPPKQVFVTSPKICLRKNQSNENNKIKETEDHRGKSVNYVITTSLPNSTEERNKITQEKTHQTEKHSEIHRFDVQNSLNHKELNHVEDVNHHDHTLRHQGNARQLLNYDVSVQQNIRKSSNKRSAQVNSVASDQIKRKISDKDISHSVDCQSQRFTCEPMNKRNKPPSPVVINIATPPPDFTQDVTSQSRNKCHLSYNPSDTAFLPRHTTQSHDVERSKLYNANTGFKPEGIQVKERKISHLEPLLAKQNHVQREVVDLTKTSIVVTPVNHCVQRTSKSPLYSNITHLKQQYPVTCQITEPYRHGNLSNVLVNQVKDCSVQRGLLEVNLSKESPVGHGHYKETQHSSLHNYRFIDELNQPVVDRKQGKQEVEQSQSNADIHRTVTHRTCAESPDEHFEEWRRRHGITQYPAYITTNQQEQTRRSGITEAPVSLCARTPPLEPRYLYVQDDGTLHPRVIEEVPLLLPSKPGVFYQEDSFYGGVPLYHGWTTAGVADGVPFKGDSEVLNSNNHLRSSSCIFMPSSQMFGSALPIAPLSPPVLNHGHVVSGQETVSVHPHLMMTSPYPQNHQIVSQNPTRPLHSYT